MSFLLLLLFSCFATFLPVIGGTSDSGTRHPFDSLTWHYCPHLLTYAAELSNFHLDFILRHAAFLHQHANSHQDFAPVPYPVDYSTYMPEEDLSQMAIDSSQANHDLFEQLRGLLNKKDDQQKYKQSWKSFRSRQLRLLPKGLPGPTDQRFEEQDGDNETFESDSKFLKLKWHLLGLKLNLLSHLCKCPPGPPGDPGPAGPTGPSGKDGVNGKDGVDGADGADGADGVDGVDGDDGVDGADGMDGLDGADGMQGIAGTPGEDGGPGPIGPPGPPGKDGVNGADGMQGIAGTPGEDGGPGPIGPPGPPGKDGTDGKDGQPGNPGQPGQPAQPG